MGHRVYRRFTVLEKRRAVECFFDCGESIVGAIAVLGYPSRIQLMNWLKELPGYWPAHRRVHGSYSAQLKAEAVRLVYDEGRSQAEVGRLLGIASPYMIRDWYRRSVADGWEVRVSGSSPDVSECLPDDIEALRRVVHRLELENDVLRGVIEILKKDPGLNTEALSNKEKTLLVNALRPRYRLVELAGFLGISKSSYEYQARVLERGDKYACLRVMVRSVFDANNHARGYRAVWAELRRLDVPVCVSEKVVRRLMREDGLVVAYDKKRRRGYSSYRGEIDVAPPNLIARDFHAPAPNQKWLTDITEFKIDGRKCYLSPVIDCFDGMVVAWRIGTSPNAELATSMLLDALSKLSPSEKPVIHSDRGWHYRSPGWVNILDSHGLERSMSKKSCSPDNSACEGFFGRLKNEFYYYQNWTGVSLEEFTTRLNTYIHHYNENRIKQTLGWQSPLEYRQQLGLAA
jgi:transposase InsO family protein/transposase-like protein